MRELHLRHGTWVAICDGARAVIAENKGDHEFPHLAMREVFESKNPLSHEQGSARPGRVFSGDGQRSATEESDFHRQAEAAFLRAFAHTLENHVREGALRELILVAPARALGILRPLLADVVQPALVGELARDYVHLPLHEIERLLLSHEAKHA